MAGSDYPVWAAHVGQRQGLTPTRALREYRANGGRISTQTWYRLWSQVAVQLRLVGVEAQRPHEAVPTGTEIQRRSTKFARGYQQNINVLMRDIGSGVIVSKPYSLRAEGLLSRGGAISAAIEHYSSYAADYELVPLGGVYTGTFALEPEV